MNNLLKLKTLLIFVLILSGLSCQNETLNPYPQWKISSQDKHPAWVPDGSQILFEFRREIPHIYYSSVLWNLDPLSGIWRVNVDGTGLVQLIENTDIYVNNLKFDLHTDGSKLVFTYSDKLYSIEVTPDSVDESSLDLITDFSGSFNMTYPKWQPSGEWILLENITPTGNMNEIYMIREDGTGLQHLFNGFTPSWHPDGQSIIAAVYHDQTGEATDLIRFYPHTETPTDTLVVKPENVNLLPVYSPDGTQIAYESNSTDSTHINIYDIEGKYNSKLITGWQPSWSPDGNTIAFTVYYADISNIWLINKDKTDLRQLNTEIITDPKQN